jgi:16S rRNA (cytidine1402-2'-O)-methyltransferase
VSILYVVATPIGNLSDISSRAIETLSSVSVIACEDTRTSSKLLKHFGVQTPTSSLHQHNEHHKYSYFIGQLDGGNNVAMITDAGMPGISDPGFLMIRATHQSGHQVRVIPGPDAVTSALVSSGLPSDSYYFHGFLPHKKGRQKQWEFLSTLDCTIIIYESPHRLLKCLKESGQYLGEERMVAVCRELTKAFEETVRGTILDVRSVFEQRPSIKGEICIVFAPKSYQETSLQGQDNEHV